MSRNAPGSDEDDAELVGEGRPIGGMSMEDAGSTPSIPYGGYFFAFVVVFTLNIGVSSVVVRQWHSGSKQLRPPVRTLACSLIVAGCSVLFVAVLEFGVAAWRHLSFSVHVVDYYVFCKLISFLRVVTFFAFSWSLGSLAFVNYLQLAAKGAYLLKRGRWLAVIVWFAAFVSALFPSMGGPSELTSLSMSCCIINHESLTIPVAAVIYIMGYSLPILCVGISCAFALHAMGQLIRTHHLYHISWHEEQQQRQRNWRFCLLLLFCSVTFLTFWFVHHTMYFAGFTAQPSPYTTTSQLSTRFMQNYYTTLALAYLSAFVCSCLALFLTTGWQTLLCRCCAASNKVVQSRLAKRSRPRQRHRPPSQSGSVSPSTSPPQFRLISTGLSPPAPARYAFAALRRQSSDLDELVRYNFFHANAAVEREFQSDYFQQDTRL